MASHTLAARVPATETGSAPPEPPSPGSSGSRPQGSRLGRVALRTPSWVLQGGLVVIFLFPLVWAAVASVSPQAGSNQVDGWGFGNYATLADYQDGVWVYLRNSVLVSAMTVALTVTISLLGGYAFARFRFPGKNLLFLATLGILMVPYATLLIPLYVLLNDLGLQNSLVGLALVMTLFQLPFATFLMRISFEAVPAELDEAALVDGAGSFRALVHVLVPSVKPGIITVGLFAFLAAWNDFITPLILISDTSKSPLPLAVSNMRQQVMGIVDYGATQAGVVVLALPCIVLFLLLQRHYVRGFMSGAVKG